AEADALLIHAAAGPIRYMRASPFERAGWTGQIDAMPHRNIAVRATWYTDTKDEGPTQGGNHRGAIIGRYAWHEGVLRGWYIGAGVRYRNALRFADGFELPGGWRPDVFLGFDASSQVGMSVQLNLD